MSAPSQTPSSLSPGTCIHFDDTFGRLEVWSTANPNRYLLKYEGWEACFGTGTDQTDIIRRGDLPEFYFRERILNPLIYIFKGNSLLHAGAVTTPRAAVILMAPTGIGKSTITASALEFSASKLATDDMIPIENGPDGILALPASHHIAMRHSLFSSAPFVHDSVKILDKTILRVKDGVAESDPKPVSAMLFLQKGNEPSLHAIPTTEAVPLALSQQIILSNPPGNFKRAQFHALLNVISQIPAYRLDITTDSRESCRRTIDCLIESGILLRK